MTDHELRKVVEGHLRRELAGTWGIDMQDYACVIAGNLSLSAGLAEFTRPSGARIEVADVYAADDGGLLQWGSPRLL